MTGERKRKSFLGCKNVAVFERQENGALRKHPQDSRTKVAGGIFLLTGQANGNSGWTGDLGVLMPEAVKRREAEKEELNWLLSSGLLGRSNNLSRVLAYICEKHFLDQDDRITEHAIAVEALGRRADFEPQSDAIVRVVMRSLRKRLQEVYETAGADRAVHILIPAGHYVPSFIQHSESAASGRPGAPPAEEWNSEGALTAEQNTVFPQRSRSLMAPIAAAAIVLLFVVVFLVHRHVTPPPASGPRDSLAALPQPKNSVHALMGTNRKPYVDHSGFTWESGNFCSSGVSVTVPSQKIAGTEDPYLYLGGIRGIAHCVFPVNPGSHEIHLHFAETTDLPIATSPINLVINAGPSIFFDVVDHAGGDGIATSMILTGVRPEADGAMHLDYTSEVSLLNAVEILPSDSELLLPVRITASPASFKDSDNKVWLSDRYFSGGRRGLFSDSTRSAKNGIYRYNRIGHFRYDIPVVPLAKYRVTLFFFEHWFGKANSGPGGPGSRVFDVACNGSKVLRNFDILAEGGGNPVVKTFDNVQATAQGNIELSFIPVVNYPLVNAIEVIAQPEP